MQIPADPPSEDLRRPVGRHILPLVLLLILLLVLPLILPLVLWLVLPLVLTLALLLALPLVFPLVLLLVLPLVKISAGPPAVSLGDKRMDREIISPNTQKVVVRTSNLEKFDRRFGFRACRFPLARWETDREIIVPAPQKTLRTRNKLIDKLVFRT